ncbi:MAG: hypothetical protein AAGC47_14180 [Bacteroidota bacterium]
MRSCLLTILSLAAFYCFGFNSNHLQFPSIPSPDHALAEEPELQKIIQEIYGLFQMGDYEKADSLCQNVVAQNIGSDSFLFWHLYGFVLKEKYELNEEGKTRSKAIANFKTSIELDSDHTIEEKSLKVIKYLNVSIFNEVSDLIHSNTSESLTLAEEYFAEYQLNMNYLDADGTAFPEQEVDYLLAMSSAYQTLAKKAEEVNEEYISRQEEFLAKALERDPENLSAQYNILALRNNRILREMEKQEQGSAR